MIDAVCTLYNVHIKLRICHQFYQDLLEYVEASINKPRSAIVLNTHINTDDNTRDMSQVFWKPKLDPFLSAKLITGCTDIRWEQPLGVQQAYKGVTWHDKIELEVLYLTCGVTSHYSKSGIDGNTSDHDIIVIT